MKATTFFQRVAGVGMLAAATLVPLGHAYLLFKGPVWVLANDGQNLFFTATFVGMACGLGGLVTLITSFVGDDEKHWGEEFDEEDGEGDDAA